jgi:hypothetical protein
MAATSPRGAFSFGGFFCLVFNHLYADSPRMVGTDIRMPGSFGCDDDEEEAEVDALILGIRKLGVRESRY